MATEPITVVSGHSDLKPITAKAEVAEAVKGCCSVVEPRGAIFNDYVDYLTNSMKTWAEEAINGRRSNADEGTGTDDGGTAVEYQTNEPVSEPVDLPVITDQQESDADSGLNETDQPTLTYLGEYTVTFYCQCEACCGRWAWSNSTASGAVPQAGRTVAAGESLPFGSIIYIDGFGEYCVQDRGVPDGWIDIYVNSHDEIPSYGMTTASVYLEV
jgi:3D (Asp-Asp-Asp) domain-containing protein